MSQQQGSYHVHQAKNISYFNFGIFLTLLFTLIFYLCLALVHPWFIHVSAMFQPWFVKLILFFFLAPFFLK